MTPTAGEPGPGELRLELHHPDLRELWEAATPDERWQLFAAVYELEHAADLPMAWAVVTAWIESRPEQDLEAAGGYAWLPGEVLRFLETLVHDLDDPTPAGRAAIRARIADGADLFLGAQPDG